MTNVSTADAIRAIESLDDLRRVAREVAATRQAQVVSIPDGGEVMLAPAPRPIRHRTRAHEQDDDDDFLAAAGSWSGLMDPDELKARLREERATRRPPLDLSRPSG